VLVVLGQQQIMWTRVTLTACAGAASSLFIGNALWVSDSAKGGKDRLQIPAGILASSARKNNATVRSATVVEVDTNNGEVSVNGSRVTRLDAEITSPTPTSDQQISEAPAEPYMALFLDEESRAKLAEVWGRFGAPGVPSTKMPHVPLISHPSTGEMHYYLSIMGQKYTVDADWIATDEHAQAAILLASSFAKELVPPASVGQDANAWLPHVTIAVTDPRRDDGKYSARYSPVLIDRIFGIAASESVLHTQTPAWVGVLPAFESTRSPDDGTYECSAAVVRRPVYTVVDADKSPAEVGVVVSTLRLVGTLCRSDKWDGSSCHWDAADSAAVTAAHAAARASVVPEQAESAATGASRDMAGANEATSKRTWPKGPYPVDPDEEICGFCRYMKEGPCGKVFALWEACILECKDAEADFVDKCAGLTFDLKECTDSEPEYYHLLKEMDDDDDAEGKDPTEPPPIES